MNNEALYFQRLFSTCTEPLGLLLDQILVLPENLVIYRKLCQCTLDVASYIQRYAFINTYVFYVRSC